MGKALLALGRPAEARTKAEHALASEAVKQVDPTLLAESKFIIARALMAEGDRTRAVELAREAQASYRTDAKRWAEELGAIETFLE